SAASRPPCRGIFLAFGFLISRVSVRDDARRVFGLRLRGAYEGCVRTQRSDAMGPPWRSAVHPHRLATSKDTIRTTTRLRPAREVFMKIAQIAPLAESCPPRLYGGTERIVSYLTEE